MKNENLNEPNFNLTNDVLFKDYYSNPDNLSVLLSLILGIKILPDEIIYENNEIISLAKGKKTRFDLRISLVNNYDIDLEMQNKNEIAFKDRAIYYMSSLIMSNLKSGGDYRTNKYYIGIWLLNTPSQVYKDSKYMKVYKISDENIEVDDVDVYLRQVQVSTDDIEEAYDDYCDDEDGYEDGYEKGLDDGLNTASKNMRLIRNENSAHDMVIPNGMTPKEAFVYKLTGKFPKSVTDRWYETHYYNITQHLSENDETVRVTAQNLHDYGYVDDNGGHYGGIEDGDSEGFISKIIGHLLDD